MNTIIEPVPSPAWWRWNAAVCIGIGLLDATQNVFVMRSMGMHHNWGRLFFTLLVAWLPWALATPFVLRLGRRYPPARSTPLSGWFAHLALFGAIVLVTASWVAGLEMAMNPWAIEGPMHFRVLADTRLYNGLLERCGSGAEALEEIRRSRPDLVFLDVQMPECGGFDVLEQLEVERTPEIVFVTAHDRYALDAFEAGALDYLLKPFDDERFELMLRRVKERIAHRLQSPSRPQSLAIKSPGHMIFVRIAEIDWIEAANYYSCLHVGSTSHLLRRSINGLEADLETHAFCRIHRSTIVNIDRVREVELNAEGEHDVRLTDDTRLRVSRRYRAQLTARLRSISTESPNS